MVRLLFEVIIVLNLRFKPIPKQLHTSFNVLPNKVFLQLLQRVKSTAI